MGICFGCCSGEHEISISSSSSHSNGHGYDDFLPFLKPTPLQQYSPPHPTPEPPKPELGPILNKPYVNITDYYELQMELGRGQFGVTYRCVERSTGLPYACKSISRVKLRRKKDIEDVRREILILEHLSGQPNIVEFKGAYEDRNYLYLVMELCSGGELFDRIVSKKSYSEKEAAGLFRQIVNVVHVCHFMGVMHRDLKPENFLMVSPAEDSPLKIIDFGLSVFIEPGKIYTQVVGSSYYIAPEVLQRHYGKEIDVWSAGIILYILLCGLPPFWHETDDGIFREIQNAKLDLQSDPWPAVSPQAKDLIQKMLTRDPKKRISAADALEHPWLKEGGEASDLPIDNAVLTRMTHFRDMNKLKKLAIKVMAENLSTEEIKGLRGMFDNIDTDKSGTITIEELREGLARLGSRIHESELQQLMDAADLDKNGTIDINEFITATMNRHRLEKEENLLKAFKFFDIDNSGHISRDELKQVMAQYGMGDEATIDEILEDVDADKDGGIDYNEFVEMMRKGAAGDQGIDLLVHSDKSPSSGKTKEELFFHNEISPSGGQTKQEDHKETSPIIEQYHKPN